MFCGIGLVEVSRRSRKASRGAVDVAELEEGAREVQLDVEGDLHLLIGRLARGLLGRLRWIQGVI